MTRSYGQYCGLSRALDVIGDRWNLLIVRELLAGPARYGRLLEGLPGLATNLLAGRLRALEAAGIVERRLSEQPNAVLYALTPWGAGLREPIESLVRWSVPLMVRGPEGDIFRPHWIVTALRALLAGKTAPRPAAVGIEIDGRLVGLRATPGGIEVADWEPEADSRASEADGREETGLRASAGRAPNGDRYDAVVRAEPAIILGLAAGALTLDQAADLVEIDGDERAARAALGQPP
ncbi:MAG: helix-turn-helix transcriptional regulator, partial [Nocardiopsaceae bacterium]|nr:helix-turn-helix transcriptional regulator [Nocardiopsaceae bacterium]